MTIYFIIISFLSIMFLTIPQTNEEEFFGRKISELIDRNLYIQNEILVKRLPAMEFFLKNDKSEEEIYIEKSKELDLRGRDLKFANFENSKFYKANLEGANLTKAILLFANLFNANLTNSILNLKIFIQNHKLPIKRFFVKI